MTSKILLDDIQIDEMLKLFGAHDYNLRILEKLFDVELSVNNHIVSIHGDTSKKEIIEKILKVLLEKVRTDYLITEQDVIYVSNLAKVNQEQDFLKLNHRPIARNHQGQLIYPKTNGQKAFAALMSDKDITFAIGPAGTGKTFLAVAYAVSLLKKGDIEKIILTRPAVEAGESLGFLPGDLKEKVDPYLQPLYDGLNELLGTEKVLKYLETGVIEIAPLAFMRGRTLSEAFIILDEAQNATSSQIKMFLTRLGFQSKMVINGDITQIDLRYKKESGLKKAIELLKDINEIGQIELTTLDVVRHPLVQKIIDAYQTEEQ